MHQEFTMRPIARIHSDFSTKFGVPRQSSLVDSLEATVVFEPEFRNPDALRGLEGFSHIWLVWVFDQAVRKDWSPTVRPPRLRGNTRMGVFATRSPFRPNGLGLSCVRLTGVEMHGSEGPVLTVAGADLMDGTPIFDIKPYVPYADAHPEAKGGFTSCLADCTLKVEFPEACRRMFSLDQQNAIVGILERDPRPHYHTNGERVYGMPFAGYDIRFRVHDGKAEILEVAEEKSEDKE